MPIYEYESLEPKKGCRMCVRRFEEIQAVNSTPLSVCPGCGRPIRRIISACHAAVMEVSPEYARVADKIAGYEREGMWSHAAELADKHSEHTKDPSLKNRALEDYKKAGYSLDTLEKHSTSKDD